MRGWQLWRAERRLRIAGYWWARGDLVAALPHVRRAWHLVRLHPAPPAALAVRAASLVGMVERDLDHPAESQAALEWALSRLRDEPPGDERAALLAATLTSLGDCHRRAGRYPQAIRTLYRARPVAAIAGPAQLAATFTALGIVAKELGSFDRAARWYARVGTLHADLPVDAASLHHNLAGLAHARRRYRQAEVHARRAVALRGQVRPANAVTVAADVAVLAAALAGQHRYDEARHLFMEAMAVCERARPPRRYEIAVHLHSLAAIDQACGRLGEAERGYRRALALKRELLGPDHPEIALLTNNLGTLLLRRRRIRPAMACFRRALAIARRHYPDAHPVRTAIQRNLYQRAGLFGVRSCG